MAIIRVKPWQVTLTIQDARDKKAKHSLYLDGSKTFAEVQAWVADYIDTVEAVILGSVVSASVSRSATVADAQIPDPNADRETGLRAMYNGAGTRERFRHYLATVRDDLFMEPSSWDGLRKPKFNPEAPEMASWRNRMIAAESLGYPITPTDSRGKTLVSFRKSYQAFKKS